MTFILQSAHRFQRRSRETIGDHGKPWETTWRNKEWETSLTRAPLMRLSSKWVPVRSPIYALRSMLLSFLLLQAKFAATTRPSRIFQTVWTSPEKNAIPRHASHLINTIWNARRACSIAFKTCAVRFLFGNILQRIERYLFWRSGKPLPRIPIPVNSEIKPRLFLRVFKSLPRHP